MSDTPRLKEAILPVVFALCATPAFAQAGPAEGQVASGQPATGEIALAQEIVDRGFPKEQREELFFSTMDQFVVQMRQAAMAQIDDADDTAAIAIVDDWLAEYIGKSKDTLARHIPSIMDGMARSYANLFTERELRDILAFVSTDSGKAYFTKSSAVVSDPDFAAANQAYMNDVMAELPAARQDLVQRLMDHFAQTGDEGA